MMSLAPGKIDDCSASHIAMFLNTRKRVPEILDRFKKTYTMNWNFKLLSSIAGLIFLF